MDKYDYIVVGAGSSGSVLAERLSADPSNSVLLIEAGPDDSHVWYRIPKGFGKIMASPEMIWHFEAEGDEGNDNRPAIWHRGKTLGGSSSINGMVYMRGQPQDYDGWEAMGCEGWNWSEMSRCFRAIENHSLGADDVRGGSGPLRITAHPEPDPVCEAFVASAAALGLERRDDINRPAQEGVAHTTRTIAGGVRQSSARAFLTPNRKRRNLEIRTGIEVNRVLFEGQRAIGVEGRDAAGNSLTFHCGREVVLSAGAVQSPLILQRSGVGPARLLSEHGIAVLQDSPEIGANMREHYLLMLNYRLRHGVPSQNQSYGRLSLFRNALRYFLTKRGPLAHGSHDACAFFRSDPALDRPDSEILMAAWSIGPTGTFDDYPGMHLFAYNMRPESTGTVSISSSEPYAAPLIQPRYLATDSDRRVAVADFKFLRKIAQTRPLADLVEEETRPGKQVQSDDEILDAYRRLGQIGHHAACTVRMGGDADLSSPLDPKLRVRGVSGLRVCDISVMPTMVSGNTNGPAMAIGWRAAEIILADRN